MESPHASNNPFWLQLLVKSGKSVLDSVPEPPVKAAADKEKAPEDGQSAGEGQSVEEQLRRKQMRVQRAKIILAELGVEPRT